MRFTRIAAIIGVAVLGFLCWLAAIGFTAVKEILITLFVLVILVAGGNWLSGRSTRTPGAPPRSSSLEDQPSLEEQPAQEEQPTRPEQPAVEQHDPDEEPALAEQPAVERQPVLEGHEAERQAGSP